MEASAGAGGNAGRGRYRRKRYGHDAKGSDRENEKHLKTSMVNVDVNSAVIEAFQGFQVELDTRNDTYERIVKLSRDITIESKRLIFLLHRVTGSDDRDSILTDAAARMLELRTSKFLPLAKELKGQDPYQFLRAFSPGLQEYIESVTFYHYLADNQLASLDSIQTGLTFTLQDSNGNQNDLPKNLQVKNSAPRKLPDECIGNSDVPPSLKTLSDENKQDIQNRDVASEECLQGQNCTTDKAVAAETFDCESLQTVSVPVPPTEYMLGVADFTGELMKMAINSVGSGDLRTPRIVAEMMRTIHDAFASIGNIPRELRHKLRVLRQSLQKVETACYTMKVRGSEIPSHMLADVFSTAGTGDMFCMDDNEEFYD
ncbi:unnamed protein product [Candidula unifasciata]|uniref:Translin-associated protein X n=1 Tax=Candidula unifasciata TaxID=100452 RepID=A0A8S3Z6P9_9EUPU|nr:unnamed protein product [Candidula unifasciata]